MLQLTTSKGSSTRYFYTVRTSELYGVGSNTPITYVCQLIGAPVRQNSGLKYQTCGSMNP